MVDRSTQEKDSKQKNKTKETEQMCSSATKLRVAVICRDSECISVRKANSNDAIITYSVYAGKKREA